MHGVEREQELALGPGELETDHVHVRNLTMDDLAAVVKIDAMSTGMQRADFYRTKIKQAVEDSTLQLSLAAEIDDLVVGFLTVTFYYGEFGRPEKVAVLDAIGVHPEFRGRKVAKALLRQLLMHLGALGVESVRTEVSAEQAQLLSFLARAGFLPAARVCLEMKIG